MKLQQLRYMIAVVQSGSFNQAAKRLFISQSSLSSAIKELENETGIELFIRTNKGISLTTDGAEFLGYARQVVEQTELLEQRYLNKKPARQLFSVSTQHYAFSVDAFVSLIRKTDADEYDFALRETKTHEIFEDVKTQRSEIGILYKYSYNEKVVDKFVKENHLKFSPLFEAKPHVFVSTKHPLVKQAKVSVNMEELKEYPYLLFDQGEFNSFYFSEEILSTVARKKSLHVSDRATLFNLLIGLNGYTISTGVIGTDLNGTDIVALPLNVDETICVGWISSANRQLSRLGKLYIEELQKVLEAYDVVTLFE